MANFGFFHSFHLKEDAQEEFGWKLVHGDVFRPPKKGMLLSIMLGCGTQIFIMLFFTLGKSTESGRISWFPLLEGFTALCSRG